MQELTALPADTVTLLHLADWLEEIGSATAKFQIAREMQTAEQSQYQVGLVKDTHTAADAAYKLFVASVNTFAIAFGEANIKKQENQNNYLFNN